jgi:hypothetical protein
VCQAKKDSSTMKQYLEKHIKDIFDSLGFDSTFEVYDCNIDTLPEWTKNIELTNEFIVCCKDFLIQDRLQVFTGKKTFKNGNQFYWFEGDRISIINTITENESNVEINKIEFLKTETRLPTFLDDFIFNRLNAIYAPDFQRFEYNLDLTGEEIHKYLGTYFPRSYAESFCIFDNIFQNIAYHQITASKTCLNILSIGSGTGGDIIGLLTSIEKFYHNVEEINIWTIDGNQEALNVLKQIVDDYRNHTTKNIRLIIEFFVFDSISEFQNEGIVSKEFDFILSFKFICEIISLGGGNYDNSYYEFAHKFLPLLSKDGLCLLLDVTTKPIHNTYNPILMNRQINQALRELNEFETLLPIPCSSHSENCYIECFQQKIFTITHSKHTSDKSKVAYRVLVPKELKRKIEIIDNDSKQLIYGDRICPHTEKEKNVSDAFFLKQTAE